MKCGSGVRSRTSPVEVCERAIERARRAEGMRWLISLDEADVRRQAEESARRLAAGQARSPLEGVPIAIKDQLDVRGQPTTCGTSFLRQIAARDAAAVARLRAAGAVLFGKANLYELALGPSGRNPHHGSARNPWDPARDTGGSSSGAAALVAAGVVPLALGTDLGGSLRIPASLCGVVALKPTFGRVPTAGMWPTAPSLEHVGPIGATLEHVRLAYAVLTGLTGISAEPPEAPRPLRLGVCDAWWQRAEPATAAVADRALRRLAAHGGELRAVALPPIDRAVAIGSLLSAVEAAAAWRWAVAARAPLSPAVRIPLAVGHAVSAVELVRAQEARAEVSAALDAAFAEVDLLALPTTDSTARRYRADGEQGELDEAATLGRVAFTLPFNLGGLPALTLPCGLDRDGLPVGLQLIAPRAADERLLGDTISPRNLG